MPAMEMVHDVDPAKELFDKVGPLDDYPLFSSNILVAIYQRSDKTKSNLYLPDSVREEDRYQGKVGLVLSLGPLAFQEDEAKGITFPQKAKVGDWIVFRTSDTWQLAINKQPCRMMPDVAVRMIVPAPDKVF